MAPPKVDPSALDRQLLASYDEAWAWGAARAGSWLTCCLGCTDCCIGLFEISGADAWRLRKALSLLVQQHPDQAQQVWARARAQWAMVRSSFPGDLQSGALAGDEAARQEFFARFAQLPCPLLEPSTGGCSLYQARPLACRSYGLPARLGASELPPCPRNFRNAPSEVVAASTVAFDPDDVESQLLQALGWPPDTIVAAALVLPFWEDAEREVVWE
ncbi:MAG: YkgJ family cysteine cluster protein [Thermoanaerobaculum sp.]|nr:YkgJ family cysteine cluster protein [Thermoanaerobaculum sp.]MDW7968346.1 YkgJ family cysteine cluster protein [Thermoanaerobaculum sp.]